MLSIPDNCGVTFPKGLSFVLLSETFNKTRSNKETLRWKFYLKNKENHLHKVNNSPFRLNILFENMKFMNKLKNFLT